MNAFLAFVICIPLYIYHAITSFILCIVPRSFRTRKDITGKKVLITGAGSGVGRQLAVEFSKHSTCLILADINRESLLGTKKLLDGRSSVFVYDCDVSDYKKVYEMAKQIQKDVGDVDILVNNAGIVSGQYLVDLPEERIIKTMEVNVLAHFWICKSFLPSMMAKNEGHIVTIASIAGLSGAPKLTDYCASKFAAIGFSESLELELRSKSLDGIKVTIVNPSHIDTGLFDGAKLSIGKPLSPEYVAEEIIGGILEEEETIVIPSYLNFIFCFKPIIPRWIVLAFYKMTDAIKSMENFRGRSHHASREL